MWIDVLLSFSGSRIKRGDLAPATSHSSLANRWLMLTLARSSQCVILDLRERRRDLTVRMVMVMVMDEVVKEGRAAREMKNLAWPLLVWPIHQPQRRLGLTPC